MKLELLTKYRKDHFVLRISSQILPSHLILPLFIFSLFYSNYSFGIEYRDIKKMSYSQIDHNIQEIVGTEDHWKMRLPTRLKSSLSNFVYNNNGVEQQIAQLIDEKIKNPGEQSKDNLKKAFLLSYHSKTPSLKQTSISFLGERLNAIKDYESSTRGSSFYNHYLKRTDLKPILYFLSVLEEGDTQLAKERFSHLSMGLRRAILDLDQVNKNTTDSSTYTIFEFESSTLDPKISPYMYAFSQFVKHFAKTFETTPDGGVLIAISSKESDLPRINKIFHEVTTNLIQMISHLQNRYYNVNQNGQRQNMIELVQLIRDGSTFDLHYFNQYYEYLYGSDFSCSKIFQ